MALNRKCFWSVYAKPDQEGVHTAESIEVIPEKFAFLGLVLPLVWGLYHRVWWVAGIYVILSIITEGLVYGNILDAQRANFIMLGYGLWVGLEGNHMRASQLERSGRELKGVTYGSEETEAILRYLDQASASSTTTERPVMKSLLSSHSPTPNQTV